MNWRMNLGLMYNVSGTTLYIVLNSQQLYKTMIHAIDKLHNFSLLISNNLNWLESMI